MSAALKTTSVLGGLALVGAATTYAFKSPEKDFGESALAAAEHAAPNAVAAVKPKLPTNFFQYTRGEFKISNARNAA